MDEIKKEYGRGVYVYFLMLRFLGFANLLVGLVALVPYIIAEQKGMVLDGIATLFLSSYPKDAFGGWIISSIVMLVVAVLIGPAWKRYQAHVSRRWTGEAREEEVERDDAIIEYDKNGARVSISSSSRRCRKYISLFIFTLVIGVQAFMTWYLHILLADTTDSIVAQVIALSITVANIVWKSVGKKLTIFEKHSTWTEYREWDTGKVFVLKLCNLMILYIVKTVTAQSGIHAQECPLRALGFQFFWLLFYDLTLNNVVELAAPIGTAFVYKKLGWSFKEGRFDNKKEGRGDNASKPPFDLAEEYVEVLYRQVMVFLGMLVFPLLALISAFSFILEHWLDKARLVYVCQKPTTREEPLRGKLVLYLYILTVLAAVASFPNGAIWVLSGYNMEHCHFWL